MLGSIADGNTKITNLLRGADVLSTMSAMRALGIQIEDNVSEVIVYGQGLHGLKAAPHPIDCGNSGTTMRLLMGLLAGQPFDTTLIGDASLSKRPMKRVAEPLRQMGAQINLTDDKHAPVHIQGSILHGVHYELPIASAQVKSAIMLAGLYCDSAPVITGQIQSRDHTERMFELFRFDSSLRGALAPRQSRGHGLLRDARSDELALKIPGDPSTAAFWVVAATLVPGSDITLEGISFNPTRIGYLDVLERMGAKITRELTAPSPEPAGNLRIQHAKLSGTTISVDEIPNVIDEIPILAIAMSQATGISRVSGAEELRVKESDRLEAIAENLSAMGAGITLSQDGFSITGPAPLQGANIRTHDDHRIAMAFAIAGLVASGQTSIDNPSCVRISYPAFFETLERLQS
jgi:3-phosphoshikimate 1-carboxyvinyltransferase